MLSACLVGFEPACNELQVRYRRMSHPPYTPKHRLNQGIFKKDVAASHKSAGRSHGSQRSLPIFRIFASRLWGELPYFPRSYERGYEII